jgi:hypothetical protein
VGAAGGNGRAEAPASDPRFASLVALAGVVGFALACFVVDRLARAGFYGATADALWVAPYFDPARAILGGAFPYRDVAIEYPPLGLPVFLAPALVVGSSDYPAYLAAFEVLIALCGMAIVPFVVATLVALGAPRLLLIGATAFVAATPLLLGPLTLSRYDLWPALLTAAAMWAAVRGRRRLTFALVALGTLAKVYPAVLLPILIAEAWRARGRREALIGVAVAAAVGVAIMAPFVVADPAAGLDPLTRSVARPLQIESLGASVLVVLHGVAGLSLPPVEFTFGSYNLGGSLASAVATTQSLAMVAGIALVWLLAATRPLSRHAVVLASAGALAVEVALGKVFSAQYMLWLVAPAAVVVPATALVPTWRAAPRLVRALGPMSALAVALILTVVVFPGRYREFVATLDLGTALVILARDLLVLGIAAGLVVALWRWRDRRDG